MRNTNTSIQKEIKVVLGALLCCTLWGSAFPGIKIGYRLWNIESSDTFLIILFAGVRFFLAGLLVILFASALNKRFLFPKIKEIPQILLLSLFQTIGQYIFFYIGLAHTSGVNSAVINSLTTFFSLLIACLIFRLEKLTIRKILGCILGFSGILLIHFKGGSFTFHLLGDGLVALSALCYGVSSCLIKQYSKEHDSVTYSGYQFLFGGLIMMLVGVGGKVVSGASLTELKPEISAESVDILMYLALVSSVAYTLWGILLRNNDVSKISVFGFTNPAIGVILSALLLSERDLLGPRFILALALVCLGIVVVNIRSASRTDISKKTGKV